MGRSVEVDGLHVLSQLTGFDARARAMCAKASQQPCGTLRKGMCANKQAFEKSAWSRAVRGRASRMGIGFSVAHHLDEPLIEQLLTEGSRSTRFVGHQ